MSKSTANSEPKQSDSESKVIPIPDTLAGCYNHAWDTLFKKLSKEEQAKLVKNLNAPPEHIRGELVTYSNVRSFVKNVAELGEELHAKKQKRGSKTPQ